MRLFILFMMALCASGCASTLGVIYAGTGQWPTSSSMEQRTWIHGEPTRALKVEARFSSPLRVVCVERVHEPAAHIASSSYGLDTGARLAIGFVGLSELAIATVIAALPAGEDHNPGTIVGTTLLGLDGLASLIMAFVIPDSEHHHERVEPPRDYDVDACPPDVAFEVEGQVLPVQPDGRLPAAANMTLVEAVVFRNAPITLRFRDSVTTTFVPPEVRCIWGYDNLRRVEDLVCPPRAVLEAALPR